MKLQTKLNLRFLILLLLVFMIAGGILFMMLERIVNHNLDKILKGKCKAIIENFSENRIAEMNQNDPNQKYTFKLVEKKQIERIFSDTLILDKSENEFDKYRKLTFWVAQNNSNYKVEVQIRKLETEDLVGFVFWFLMSLFVIIVVVLYVLNSILSASLWKPFYKTLSQLHAFKVDQQKELNFESTSIFEFEQLNFAVETMVAKMQVDFKNLKEFTENASHEAQTPIAIIKSKLETVLQDSTLPAVRYEQIQVAYTTVIRLSKLIDALLLLSKIENQQFSVLMEMNLCDLIKQRLEDLQELFNYKHIEMNVDVEIPFVVKINANLADILINNLLSNALKHNIIDGKIQIVSTNQQITISNTGIALNTNPENLFQRFSKHNTGNESTGLGLAIASEICSTSGLLLKYIVENKTHELLISIK